MAKLRRVVIREKLYPDSHDALVEVLSKYPRQAGNQVVLAMSEACLGLWPITEADYNVSDGAESQTVKLTLSEEKYPKIFALYMALPRGVKGQAIINLLNRHQMMRHADPGKVNDALNAALLGRSLKADSEVTLPDSIEMPVEGDSSLRNEVGGGALNSKASPPKPDRVIEVFEHQAETPSIKVEEEMLDPLAGLPAMDFT